MARGQEAKNYVICKIKEAFGENFIGEVDKKIYVWSKENGEPMQVAISLTCPKTPVESINAVLDFGSSDGGLNFDDAVSIAVSAPKQKVEISAEEKQTVLDLMEKLGL